MTEPVIRLPAQTLHSRAVVQECRWKLSKFVRQDAYLLYDYEGGSVIAPPGVITREHLRSANAAMLARSRVASWEPFLYRPLPELLAVPPDLDLIDGPDGDIDIGLGHLGEVVRAIAAQPWLTDMAASKVLHLRLPRFVALSDSYVRR